MAKKKEDQRASTGIKFRCRPADIEAFKRAAEAEGFSGMSAWALYHLRRQAAGNKSRRAT